MGSCSGSSHLFTYFLQFTATEAERNKGNQKGAYVPQRFTTLSLMFLLVEISYLAKAAEKLALGPVKLPCKNEKKKKNPLELLIKNS